MKHTVQGAIPLRDTNKGTRSFTSCKWAHGYIPPPQLLHAVVNIYYTQEYKNIYPVIDFSKRSLFSASTLLYFGRRHTTNTTRLTAVKTRHKMTVLVELYSSVEPVITEGIEAFWEGRKHLGLEVSFSSCVPLHLLTAMRSSDKGYCICCAISTSRIPTICLGGEERRWWGSRWGRRRDGCLR